VQISTIEVRTEGVERNGPSKKNKGRDDGNAESVFASLFAQAKQDTPRAKAAEAKSDDENAPNETAGVKTQQNRKSETGGPIAEAKPDAKPVVTNEGDAAAKAEGEPEQVSSAAISQPRQTAKSTAKYVVNPSPAGEVAVTAKAPAASPPVSVLNPVPNADNFEIPTVSPAAKAVATPLVAEVLGNVAGTPVIADQSASSAAGIATVVVAEPVAKASAEPVVEAKASTIPDGVVVDEVVVEPAKPEFTEVPLATNSKAVSGENAGKATESVNARQASAETAPAPLQTSGVVSEVDSNVADEAKVAVTQVDETNGEPAAESTPLGVTVEPLETAVEADESLAQPVQTSRQVTESASPDGAIRTTMVTELRTEGNTGTVQREVTVVERTTLQALPDQALRGIRYLIGNGEQTMRVRLLPESLGEVRLEVTTSRGDVTVKLASASAAVREILQTHAPGLRDALSQDGAQTVRVTVSQDMSSSSWQSSNAQRQGSQHGGAPREHFGAAYAPPKQTPPSAGARREPTHNGRLNVFA